jgi:uncharacterized protein
VRREDEGLLLSASDLSAHLGCRHRTQLDRRAALGQLDPPPPDPLLVVLQARGLAHERAYLEHLAAQESIGRVDLTGTPTSIDGLEATRAAMLAGAGVITQAPLVSNRFSGIADVLLRTDTPSPVLGGWSYRVVDTKLAAETRAGTILQLCLYTRIVGDLQDLLPEEFWVVSPGRFANPERFRTTDYLAFARKVEAELLASVEGAIPAEPRAPEPVPDCEVCRWWGRCDRQRREADHLSLVAGVSRLQRRELESLGTETLTALADARLPLEPAPRRGSPEGYQRVREQARVQRDSRGRTPIVEFLAEREATTEDGRRLGLARLPEPSLGDVFLDLEGDPFIEGGGREYLFGWVTVGEDGAPRYTARWALTASEEKSAFEALIDFLMDRWKKEPGFAVYHFGAYEPAALKRLMGRHATRADELDRLLRGERFVDLHAVVRESMRIGVEVYGLKQLEAVHGYSRELDLREASLQKHRFERALELGEPGAAPEGSAANVEAYNRDDCTSTWRLREWLEQKRAERIAAGVQLPRPTLGEGMPSTEQEERSAEIQALMDALLDGVPAERNDRDEDQQGRWLLAHLLEWHRREAKAGWWDFFRLADLPPAALRDEKNGLVDLEFVERFQEGKKLPTDRYRYAPQDHDVRAGRSLYVSKDQELGTVEAVDLSRRTIDVKKRRVSVDLHPRAVFVKDIVSPDPIPDALKRLAREVVEHGVDGPGRFRAARDLLLARPPRLSRAVESTLVQGEETTRQAAVRLSLELAASVLPTQGPPGTGKTHTGARVVCELVRAGQRVGITGPSHKVIRNLLDEVVKAAAEEGLVLRILQRVREGEASGGGAIQESTKSDCLSTALRGGQVDVAAGTVWAWAREDCEELVDTLVVDEAGQLSLANAVAAATAARNVLLLGDPQQLEQPIQGSHPEGCDRSALEHLLGEHDTVPPDRGLFLGTTWRLHPSIRRFTSELFYEERLLNHENCERQALTGVTPLAGSGLWLALVEHKGNTSSSPEEVERIVSLVRTLVRPENGWIDFHGVARPLRYEDLRIVSPYNAQVAALRAALPEAAGQIGTVDRFQGQEAPVVIYSMATSSAEEAPRGLDFVFSLNRLNVATSRARSTCIVVASPALFDAECRTPRQIKLVNALCRYRELAREI